MRVPEYKLEAHLKQTLAPLYVLSGDEPLQLGEAADRIRAAARKAGYLSRVVLEADTGFDWSRLADEARSMSLFADKKIIDLRLPSGKPGTQGSKALIEYTQAIPEHSLLLLTLPKVAFSAKWIKSLDKAGVLVQVWPVAEQKMPQWIRQRAQSMGLQLQAGVAERLAQQTEGNLLAARQELEKLLLLHGPGTIDERLLELAVSDSARFDVYALADAALAGRAKRCLRILANLRAEGMAAAVVLWALSREIRVLGQVATAMQQGMGMQQALTGAGVWKSRFALLQKALSRMNIGQLEELLSVCQKTDGAIKGVTRHDPWLLLEQIALELSGITVMR